MNRPDLLRGAAALLVAGSGLACGLGAIRIGGLLLVAGGAVEFVARRMPERGAPPSPVGTYLLLILDRVGEALWFGGMAVYFYRIGRISGAGIAVACLAAYQISQYGGARATGLVLVGALVFALGPGPDATFLWWITAALLAFAPVIVARRARQIMDSTRVAPDDGAPRKRDTRAPLRR